MTHDPNPALSACSGGHPAGGTDWLAEQLFEMVHVTLRRRSEGSPAAPSSRPPPSLSQLP